MPPRGCTGSGAQREGCQNAIGLTSPPLGREGVGDGWGPARTIAGSQPDRFREGVGLWLGGGGRGRSPLQSPYQTRQWAMGTFRYVVPLQSATNAHGARKRRGGQGMSVARIDAGWSEIAKWRPDGKGGYRWDKEYPDGGFGASVRSGLRPCLPSVQHVGIADGRGPALGHGARLPEEGDGVTVRLLVGDAQHLDLEDESVDAIVCDPPYELGFMGRDWDASGVAYDPATWAEALRVAKPGAHLVAFGAPRTFPEMAVAVRLAGWERRDTLSWLFGSGFPKSLDVSKALESHVLYGGSNTRRLRQTEQDGDGEPYTMHGRNNGIMGEDKDWERKTWEPTTNLARQWEGWGTALKPAWEPIVLARKPLRGTVAQNVAAYGTGALNIDGTRIASDEPIPTFETTPGRKFENHDGEYSVRQSGTRTNGRWPANVVLDEAAAQRLDASVGELTSGSRVAGVRKGIGYGSSARGDGGPAIEGDSGGPSRFFYTSKASRSEREAGLDDLEPVRRSDGRATDIENPRLRTSARRNDHPTVKPLDLMRWLVTLVTPPGGVVLDQFMGSGSTGVAAVELGFSFIGIDRDLHYVEIARRRITHERPMRMALGDAAL